MKRFLLALTALSFMMLAQNEIAMSAGTGGADPSRYNVVWDSPSKDHTGSMPLGNGDIALNAWVEESGDLIFYIGKTDSWDDNGRLVKVGRLRVSLNPRPLMPLRAFQQSLDLITGTLRAHFGEGEDRTDIRLWVDANHPVIRVEVDSKKPVKAVASVEMWRTERFELPSLEVSDVMLDRKAANEKHLPVFVEPDSLLKDQSGRIGWFHHNAKSVGPEISGAVQGLTGFKRQYPLLHRTFGAVVTAGQPERIDDLHLGSATSSHHLFNVYVLTKHPSKPQEWLNAADELIATTAKEPLEAQRVEHERWWREFWDRSWIHVTSGAPQDAAKEDPAFVVSRAYALQRFISACAGRGQYPIKFNGSLFTVPYPNTPGDADYRRWGPGYWWQNTRLPYISMAASGDFDLMQPLFKMYGKDLMPLFKYRTRHYLNHDGVFIPECIYFWGDMFTETYGWTPFEQRDDKLQESRWHKWEWVSGPELVWMMLDYYEYTLDENFLREMALPTAHEILTFFDQHYSTDGNGKMLMSPSQAAETWWECTNPMPEIAGLQGVVKRLQSLPDKYVAAGERAFWERLKKKIPDLPIHTVDGVTMLAPAARFDRKMNIENPDLYAVFPFRLIAFNTPGKQLAIESFRHRQDRGNFGWRQDDVFAAYLGLVDTVRDYIVGRAANKCAESRFPAFWGPNYDWIPDQDHGGILLKTLQAMVLQVDGKEAFVLPAWPKEWNVEFKLRAPLNTTIEGKYAGGKVESLTVTPAERERDVRVVVGH
jgi:alpha-L-fucosidase 2